MTNLDSMLKSEDITLPTKIHIVKLMVFFSSHLWMWELDHKEDWASKNWCFQTVVMEKTLESQESRRSNQSILKEINPEYSLQGEMLKLQYFGHLMWRTNSLAKTLMLGKTEGKRWRVAENEVVWVSLTQWTWVEQTSGDEWRTGKPGVLQFMELQRVGHDLVTKYLNFSSLIWCKEVQ